MKTDIYSTIINIFDSEIRLSGILQVMLDQFLNTPRLLYSFIYS